jgi:hypothetical protein
MTRPGQALPDAEIEDACSRGKRFRLGRPSLLQYTGRHHYIGAVSSWKGEQHLPNKPCAVLCIGVLSHLALAGKAPIIAALHAQTRRPARVFLGCTKYARDLVEFEVPDTADTGGRLTCLPLQPIDC